MKEFCVLLKKLAGTVSLLLLLVQVDHVNGGGYLAVSPNGGPFRWDGPVTLNFDQGPLGKLSKEQADAMVLEAISEWTATHIPGSTVQFINGPDLAEDHGDGEGTDPNYDLNGPTDGLTAVIYDQYGNLTEQLGAGLSDSVAGFAGPVISETDPSAPIDEGIVVLNGKLISGNETDIPENQYQGVIIHEVGHLLNLDHAQSAMAYTETGFDVGSIGGPYTPRHEPDYTGVPTMFPFVLPEIDTLEIDDKSWILDMYGDTAELRGSISGAIKDLEGNPVNGVNVIAYHADDPTSMITCVTGFADGDPINAATGSYQIPALSPGSKWVVDVEPLVEMFNVQSSIGPELGEIPVLPGAPEYINDPGIESTSDFAGLSTTFVIPEGPLGVDLSGIDMTFNDINDVLFIEEVDLGTDELTAQILPVVPGKFIAVTGQIDPAEPNGQDLSFYGLYCDFFRVQPPAGMELNQVSIVSDQSILDVLVMERRADGRTHLVASTGSSLGYPAVSLYIDSLRMGEDPYKDNTFYFGVGFTDPFLGGSDPYQVSNYTLGLVFSVSDRDAVVVAGIESGVVDPESGIMRIHGRGFKNLGGPPEVEFSLPGLHVDSVSFVNENTLDVAISKEAGYTPGTTAVQVTNTGASGGFAGRVNVEGTGEPSNVTDWVLY